MLGALLVKFVRNNTVTDKNKVLGEPLACSLELDDTCMWYHNCKLPDKVCIKDPLTDNGANMVEGQNFDK